MNKIMFISALLLSSSVAFADWAKESDFPFVILNSEDLITIDKDGLSESTFTSEYQAVNEEGRNFLVLQSYPISPDSSSVTFIKGFSKTNDAITMVNPKDIKTRNSSVKSGLTNRQEMIIPFSNIQIGSTVSYTVREKEKKNLVKGLFHRKYIQGLRAPEKSGKAKIKSLLPLYVHINDPWQSIQSKQYKDGKYFVFEFVQTKPLFKMPTEFNPILKKDSVTSIDISTMNNWSTFSATLAEKYESSLKTKIFPPAYNSIIEKANKAPSIHEKIDIVTSELAKIMTYSGDWTSFEKAFIPRTLAQVALLKTGDCKDFSVATTAMLRKMGIKANIAMVKRSDSSQSNMTFQRFSDIVDPGYFNHAIVKVKDGEKTIWVDPTNIVSNSSNVFTDIAGSSAVEISKDSPGLETIPVPPLGATHLAFDKTIKINADGSADTVTNFDATGDFVKLLLETSFAKNEETAKKYLTTLLRSDSKNSKAVFEGVDFKTRLSKKFKGVQNSFGEIIIHDKGGQK
ncbi:MAG: DUF3857 domain-containing protein, partial [Bdellovibrio sp.]|nr:DUF3857 domain-containing protein [Bdellovibrio sp.]